MKKNSARARLSAWISAGLAALALTACSKSDVSNVMEQKPDATFQAAQLMGGATKEMRENVQPVAPGFLPKPQLLTPGGPGRPALVYLSPEAKLSSYRKVMLEPVQVWAGPNSDLRKVPAKQQQELAALFSSTLYNAIKNKCVIAKTPGPNTIRFRIALVDAKEPNTAVNTVATYAPYVSTAYTVSSTLFNKGVGYFSGTATVEAYAVDAANGALLWEAVDKRGGTTALVADTLDNWRDVRHAFEAWGVQLRTRLQEVGVCAR